MGWGAGYEGDLCLVDWGEGGTIEILGEGDVEECLQGVVKIEAEYINREHKVLVWTRDYFEHRGGYVVGSGH